MDFQLDWNNKARQLRLSSLTAMRANEDDHPTHIASCKDFPARVVREEHCPCSSFTRQSSLLLWLSVHGTLLRRLGLIILTKGGNYFIMKNKNKEEVETLVL